MIIYPYEKLSYDCANIFIKTTRLLCLNRCVWCVYACRGGVGWVGGLNKFRNSVISFTDCNIIYAL